MVMQLLTDQDGSYLALDDQGRVIGRIQQTILPLDQSPPDDTVFLARSGATTSRLTRPAGDCPPSNRAPRSSTG